MEYSGMICVKYFDISLELVQKWHYKMLRDDRFTISSCILLSYNVNAIIYPVGAKIVKSFFGASTPKSVNTAHLGFSFFNCVIFEAHILCVSACQKVRNCLPF